MLTLHLMETPSVGTVISSRLFAYGFRKDEKPGKESVITVNGENVSHIVSTRISEDKRVEMAAESGTIPPYHRTVDLAAHDTNRAHAEFVVVHVEEFGDGFPRQVKILARQLDDEGNYNPQGQLITFTYERTSVDNGSSNEVRIRGEMQLNFTRTTRIDRWGKIIPS